MNQVILVIAFVVAIVAVDGVSHVHWSKVTPTGEIPADISASVTGVYDGDIYQIAGHVERWETSGTSITFSNDVYKLSSSDWHWTKLNVSGAVPAPRAYAAGVNLGSKFYMYGGYTFNNWYGNITLYRDFWVFDADTSAWTQLSDAAAPGTRGGAVAWVSEDSLYLFGGYVIIASADPYELPVSDNLIWRYKFSDNIWTLLGDDNKAKPEGRQVPQVYSNQKNLYINGGESFSFKTFNFTTPSDTWKFNTQFGHFTDVTPQIPSKNILPTRNYAVSTFVKDYWVVYSGELANGQQQEGCGAPFGQNVGTDLWIYDGNIWNDVTSLSSGSKPAGLKRAFGANIAPYAVVMWSGFDFHCTAEDQSGQVFNNDLYFVEIK